MSVPERPTRSLSLEFLRKDAKHLLRAARSGDRGALARLRAVLPKLAALGDDDARKTLRLADAQHAIACEHQFASWAVLKRHDNVLDRLLVAVRGGHLNAIVRHLGEFAALPASSVHAAAALGDRSALERHVSAGAESVSSLHRGWTPLAYTCASPLHRLSPRHSAGLLECAEFLVAQGANINAPSPDDDEGPETAIPAGMRASLAANMPLGLWLARHQQEPGPSARRLVDRLHQRTRGNETFQAVFQEYFRRPDIQAEMKKGMEEMRATFGHGHWMPLDVRPYHLPRHPQLPADRDDLWARLMTSGLDIASLGTDGRTVGHRLAERAPASLIALMVERGLDPNGRDDRGHTVLAAAVRGGNTEAAAVLRSHGGDETLVSVVDRFIGACARLDDADARALVVSEPGLLRELHPDDYDVLIGAAATDRFPVAALMLELGVHPDGQGLSGATALHVAAWRGHREFVSLLLAHGASPDIRDTLYGERAVDWARHGANQCRDAPLDYAGVVSALEDAAQRA